MRRLSTWLLTAGLAFGLVACGENADYSDAPDSAEPMEEAGEMADEAVEMVDEAADTAEDAADSAEEAMEEAGDDAMEAAEDTMAEAEEAMDEAAEAVEVEVGLNATDPESVVLGQGTPQLVDFFADW